MKAIISAYLKKQICLFGNMNILFDGKNTAGRTSDSLGWHSTLLSISFNQDASCFATGLRNRSCVYGCKPFKRHEFAADGGIGAMAMLYRTNLLAMVGGGDTPAFSPRRLRLVNTTSRTALCELQFETTVLSIKMNRERLVIALQNKIHIFDLDSMNALHMLSTPPNSAGLISLQATAGSQSDSCFLAFPGGTTKGEVVFFDVRSLKAVQLFQAHQHPLVAMEFNASGTAIATASTEGTIVRVFKVPSGERLYAFRRGSRKGVIRCLSFDISGQFLCAGSASGTIHFYNCGGNDHDASAAKSNEYQNVARDSGRGGGDGASSAGLYGSFSSAHSEDGTNLSNGASKSQAASSSKQSYLASFGSMVGTFIPESVDTTRSFAQVRLGEGSESVAAYLCAIMAGDAKDSKFFVTVVSVSGIFSLYSVDKTTGETRLEEENALFESQSEVVSTKKSY